jgi:hypothetical protein
MISTPGTCTNAINCESPFGRSPRCPQLWWSRPMPVPGCSMVARMPRYAPAPSDIHSESRIPATGQNDSSRHVLALFDSRSERIIEQSSGLLIRGFGVQVPGGAPGLSRHYTHLLCLFSGLVGPWWVQRETSFWSAELSFLSLGMLKVRLSRRVCVVRVLGSIRAGWGHAPSPARSGGA